MKYLGSLLLVMLLTTNVYADPDCKKIFEDVPMGFADIADYLSPWATPERKEKIVKDIVYCYRIMKNHRDINVTKSNKKLTKRKLYSTANANGSSFMY